MVVVGFPDYNIKIAGIPIAPEYGSSSLLDYQAYPESNLISQAALKLLKGYYFSSKKKKKSKKSREAKSSAKKKSKRCKLRDLTFHQVVN